MEIAEQLTTTHWRNASAKLAELEAACLTELKYESLAHFLKDPAVRITIVLIHGGNASRWQKSLSEHPDLAQRYHATPADPRGLALVPNFLTTSPESIPAITYAYWGMRPLLASASGQPLPGRRHLTHFRNPADAGRFAISARLGGVVTDLRPAQAEFRDQPPGHAAVLCEFLPEFSDTDIVITHFGSDPISPRTAIVSALVMRTLQQAEKPAGALIPTAPGGAYPVSIDESGLVRSLSHTKLGQVGAETETLTQGGSNIGTRVYDARTLRGILADGWAHYQQNGRFRPDGGEFSLDHVDAQIGAAGMCRQLYIATPAETHPAKDIARLEACLTAQHEIITQLEQTT